MEILVILLIVIVVIGALLGGKSFGGTVRKGCGFVILLIVILIAVGLFFYSRTDSNSKPDNQEVLSTDSNSALFIALDNCEIYIKPNIESETIGNLEIGKEIFVKNINKYKYFYNIIDENNNTFYVRKECLKIKAENK